ncbi:hypothetical protein FS749_013115 [Ceratobasidium sp. UAMH 11750]|nr:hypothetical protein FS749_013115 [Ceratobasidium sp. UAMH 11750]
MPRPLAGAALAKAGPCDPRCKQHAELVSQRVRQECTRRIELSLKIQAALPHEAIAESPPDTSGSRDSPPRGLDLRGRALATLFAAPPPPHSLDHLDEEEDTTMPTWGVPSDAESNDNLPHPEAYDHVPDNYYEPDSRLLV